MIAAIAAARVLERIESAPEEDFPYPHAIVPQLFEPEDAEALLDWLEVKAQWWEQHRDFYTHDTCDNLLECPLMQDGGPLSREARAGIAALLSRRFQIDLDGTNVTIGAHRMHPGHGVGIHTDDPALGTESLRLLVTLRRDPFNDRSGGHLCLFSAPEMSAISAIVRPMHNSAIAFPLSDKSYHAVNDVTEGVRYSLIIGFWDAKHAARAGVTGKVQRPARGEVGLASLPGAEPLLAFLRENGARHTAHSGASLMDHLIGVASILLEWEAPRDVVTAGLFHSVYGTATFHQQLFSERDRPIVQAAIGERAEYLVWLFSVIRFSEVYRFAGEENFLGRRRDASTPIQLTEADVRDLNLIACANLLEQLPVVEFSAGEIYEWRGVLQRMKRLFPPKAVTALEAVFAEPQSEAAAV